MKKTKAHQNQTAENQRWMGKKPSKTARGKKAHYLQRKKDEDESRFLTENVASKKIVEQCH